MPRPARKIEKANDDLARELSKHARRAAGIIRLRRGLERLPSAIVEGMPFLLIAPAGYLLFRFFLWMSAPIDPPTSFGLAVLCLLAPYILYVLFQFLAAASEPVAKKEALSHVDEDLGLADRLQTADEFLGRDQRSSFMVAAIEDAARVSSKALDESLTVSPDIQVPNSKAWLFPIGGAVLVLLGLLIPVAGKREDRLSQGNAEFVEAESEVENLVPKKKVWTKPNVLKKDVSKSDVVSESQASRGAEGAVPSKPSKMKAGSGKTKAGKVAPVGAPSGAAQAKGVPSDQGKAAKSKKAKAKQKKPRKPKDEKQQPKKSEEMKNNRQSGTTMGRGSGRGSSKNPVASEWSSKDQTPHDDEDPEDDDEEVEEESENSDARGGLQPSLRDRRPPASRDLAISFGNQPGGDGRGGPSQRKKSRGTASLVLGVPIPDHIKGQMNPGTTKITQERIEPKKEESLRIKAADRKSRRGNAGATVTPQTDSRMNRLIENYFRARRAVLERDETQ